MTSITRLRKLFLACSIVATLVLCLVAVAVAQTGVTAEAIGTANIRSVAAVEGELLGTINSGTQYPIVGRSEFFPWVLIASPADGTILGWVFNDLVTVRGNLATVPISSQEIGAAGGSPAPAPQATGTLSPANVPASAVAPGATPEPLPATPAPAGSVIGNVAGEINVRYGPGVDYPRIGVVQAGTVFVITQWHTTLPWVQVEYAPSPNGFGWVAVELLQIEGDLTSLPATSITDLLLPTLTPTPAAWRPASVIGQAAPPPVSAEFAALGDNLFSQMLAAGFDPATSRFGAFFVMDLQTGEAISVGGDVAFSGTSVNKLAILTDYFRTFEAPLRDDQAVTMGEAMICSENISTNEMLSAIGGGNPYTGAEDVSAMLSELGLERSFIFTPYANDPFITPQAPLSRRTDADQVSAQPDPYNQITVEQTGALLNSIYQCAYNSSGLLLETYPDQFTPNECRLMLSVMNYNRIGVLLETGVPANVAISHKHGWIDDTHGDAAIVFSPGGAYVIVTLMHGPIWLNFEQSEPLIGEMSRTVYNYFNPDAPLEAVRLIEGIGDVQACNNALLGSPVIGELIAN
ncbi:MAG: SH3 domain-containing protein [Pleurocapsa minor GSE-CHR-MK-17-07R]|jgi:uncharacterized protein YraI|nr:SH3 domain-containing protein [Pleurocapsa minor GSE-CHR-MK 17-07R]